MSLALIQETSREVRRLAIAGSSLAVGDFRLKKLAEPLTKAGAQVPVFGQVGNAINDLIRGSEADSPTNLLALSTLVNAILYTQGATGSTADFEPLPTMASARATTTIPARVLKPLITALTSTGGGRFEIVESAVDQGLFGDLRLIDPAIRALDDNYPELADLVAEKVLPTYGPSIIPRIQCDFDPKGKKADARRLRVMHRLDPTGSLDLCKSALEEGSTDVKIAAINCLGEHEDSIPLLKEQTKSKNRSVREAALNALAAYDRPEVAKLFTEMIKGKAADLFVAPFRRLRSKQVLKTLLAEGEASLETAIAKQTDGVVRLFQILECLNGRSESEVETFLVSCMTRSKDLSRLKTGKNCVYDGKDILGSLASSLQQIGSTTALNAILEHRDHLPSGSFSEVFQAALQVWPPEKTYEAFSPMLTAKKGSANVALKAIEYIATVSRREYQSDCEAASAWSELHWDPRWLDAAVKADLSLLAFALARPGHKGAQNYFLKKLKSKTDLNRPAVILALARCEYVKLTDVFLDAVKSKTKSASYFDWETQQLFECIPDLPESAIPKLEAFAASLDDRFVDRFLEPLEALRAKANPA